MDFKVMSDRDVEKELGQRIKMLRLRKNLTQDDLASRALLHRNAISALESGKGSRMSTMIAVLRELGAIENLDAFLPEITVSPMQLAKLHGRERKRAFRDRTATTQKRKSEW